MPQSNTKSNIKFIPVRSSIFILLFATCLLTWFIQQPAIAADRYQTTPGAATTYVVKPGDTLTAIAMRFDTTVAALLELNNLASPHLIYSGQTLVIRAAEATATPGSTVPEATATLTKTPTVSATATATPAATATVTATAVATTTPSTTLVWTDPAAPIELFSPVTSGLYHSPIEVVGFSQTFEGNVNLRLSDSEGNILAERNTIGGSVDGFAFFHSYLRFSVTEPITGVLEVFDISAQDGSEINTIAVPMTLLPGQRVLDITHPTPGGTVCSPVVIAGYSNTFEATLTVDLRERNGDAISQTVAMGGNLGIYAEFLATLDADATTAQPLLVGAYEEAASGAGAVDQTRFPVTLYPADSEECP